MLGKDNGLRGWTRNRRVVAPTPGSRADGRTEN